MFIYFMFIKDMLYIFDMFIIFFIKYDLLKNYYEQNIVDEC